MLTAYDGKTIDYDQIGNPRSDGTWGYTWQHGRQLASLSYGSNNWVYTYNADGMRTSRVNGDTVYTYVYNGSQLVQMKADSWVEDAVMTFTYDAGGTPQTITYNGTKYYYITNLQGDVVTILDGTGAAVVQYTYDAWGKPLSTTGTLSSTLGRLNPLRYRGYVYDWNSGLYYLQSRYYDPSIGRFINADAFAATGQGLLGNNMFAYCNNNPVSFVDPTGNAAIAALGVVITAVAGLFWGLVSVTVTEFIIDAMPSKEEHYSRNENQSEVFEMDPQEIIDSDDWYRVPDEQNRYHRHTMGEQGEDAADNVKYMTKDKRKEVIINFSDKQNPQIVTDPFNVGTYNFGTDPVMHVIQDVVPYYLWGNSEQDAGIEYMWDRIWGA